MSDVHVHVCSSCTPFTSYPIRTSYTHYYYEVESTFPLYSINLVSGAFFNKERNGPACALQPEARKADRRAATSAATRPPPTRHESRHEAGTSHGTPEPTAGGAPAAPRDIAVRYAEQQRLVAEVRGRLNHGLNPPRLNPLLGGSSRAGAIKTTTTTWGARNSANKDSTNVSTAADTRKKHGKWFHRLRDR